MGLKSIKAPGIEPKNTSEVIQEEKKKEDSIQTDSSTYDKNRVDQGFIWHEVQQGEGLYRISKTYNVSVQQIMDWNNLSETNINVGQKLKIFPPK